SSGIGDRHDLLFAGVKGTHDGFTGTDALYADWSEATADIFWTNDPAQTVAVNGISVRGVERLLIATGSGDDVLANLLTNTNDAFITGAGDDTLSGGAGQDALTGGAGADRFVDTAANLHQDTITDLSVEDVIEVTGVRFGALRYNSTTGVLELDTSGNGSFATRINLSTGLAGEFLATPSALVDAASTQVRLMLDSDGDGVGDFRDNAIFSPNADQRDTDGDGYGNVVDADLNQDNIVDFFDLSMFDSVFFTSDADADLNGDGQVDFFDLSILDDLFGKPPGPSHVDNQPALAPATALLMEADLFDFSVLEQQTAQAATAEPALAYGPWPAEPVELVLPARLAGALVQTSEPVDLDTAQVQDVELMAMGVYTLTHTEMMV
ncbi:MAG: hypothetical protein KDI01_05590, partial [Halioglobus sp.]|nr:hypothetical protein [Halioglobus sp.]